MTSASTPRILIVSSSEALPSVKALQAEMDWAHTENWSQGFINLTETVVQAFETRLREFTAAIIFLTPDDVTISRGKRLSKARDNVVLETGWAMGVLSPKRVFMVAPKDAIPVVPTDLLGICLGTYDRTNPNQQAAFTAVAEKIRKALDPGNLAPFESLRVQARSHINQVHPAHLGRVQDHLGQALAGIFSRGVLRDNWDIRISFDMSAADMGLVKEMINWEYNLTNFLNVPVSYTLALISHDQDDGIRKYTCAKNGTVMDLKPTKSKKGSKTGHNSMAKVDVQLGVGEHCTIAMDYTVNHSTSKETHQIHNALAPREPTTGVSLNVIVPDGYEFSLSTLEVLQPQKNGAMWFFRFPETMLPGSVIEYCLERNP